MEYYLKVPKVEVGFCALPTVCVAYLQVFNQLLRYLPRVQPYVQIHMNVQEGINSEPCKLNPRTLNSESPLQGPKEPEDVLVGYRNFGISGQASGFSII